MTRTRASSRLQARAAAASPAPQVAASSQAAAFAAQTADIPAERRPHGPCTRLQARKRARHEHEQQQEQQLQHHPEDRQQPDRKKHHISTSTLALAVIAQPSHPCAARKVASLFERLVAAPWLSPQHFQYGSWVFKVAAEAPEPLLQALLPRQHVLHHLLRAMRSSHGPIAEHAALTIVLMLRAVSEHAFAAAQQPGAGAQNAAAAAAAAGAGAAAAVQPPAAQAAAGAAGPGAPVGAAPAATTQLDTLLAALLAPVEPQSGFMQLLQVMHSSIRNVAVLAASGVCMLTGALQMTGGPEAVNQLADAILAQQQQGLTWILQALGDASISEAAVNIVRSLALAAPQRLLPALLSQQQRRGQQHLLRTLDSSSESTAAGARAAVAALAQAANGQQLQALLKALWRVLRQGSFGAARLVLAVAQLPGGPLQLQQHIGLLLQLLPQQGPSSTMIAAALWTVMHHDAAAAAQHLAAHDPAPLLQTMAADGEPAVLAAGTVCLLSLSDQGQQLLSTRVEELLAAAQPQRSPMVAAMALRTIGVLSEGVPEAQHAVLQQLPGVLNAMLLQHADAAATAGKIVLSLLDKWDARQLLSQQHNIDALLQVVKQRTPAMIHAARAIAQIAAAVPDSRVLLAARQRSAVIHGLQDILQDLLMADSEFIADESAAYEALAPVYYSTVAAAQCQFVPDYLGLLVQVMQRPELTAPAFEALHELISFKSGVLGLAPHIEQVRQAVTAQEVFLARYQDILEYMTATVQSAVLQLQQEQALAEAHMQHAALQLAQAHARHRRRPRTRKLRVLFVLLLRHFRQLGETNGVLVQQLAATRVVP